MTDRITALWKSQENAASLLSLEAVHREAEMLDKRIARRDRIEYIAGGATAALFLAVAYVLPFWTMRLACIAVVAGIAFTCLNLYRRRPKARDTRYGKDCRSFYRSELTHQRDMLRSVAWWYLGPLVPGLIFFFGSVAYEGSKERGWQTVVTGLAPPFAISAGIFLAIWLLNRFAANRLQCRIDSLDSNDISSTQYDSNTDTGDTK